MSHDKIRAAARKRMAETGERYAAARREVIKDHHAAGGEEPLPGTEWYAISYREAGLDRLTAWLDSLLGKGPGSAGAEVDSDQIRIRMGSFRLDILRGSVRSASRSRARLRGTTGVHGGRGRWLVNGSADGLVELAIEPPRYLDRGLSTLFRKEKVSSLSLSLVDPDGFIAAVERDGHS